MNDNSFHGYKQMCPLLPFVFPFYLFLTLASSDQTTPKV